MFNWFKFKRKDDIFAEERRKRRKCRHSWTKWSIGLHVVTLAPSTRTRRCTICAKIERQHAKTIWVK